MTPEDRLLVFFRLMCAERYVQVFGHTKGLQVLVILTSGGRIHVEL